MLDDDKCARPGDWVKMLDDDKCARPGDWVSRVFTCDVAMVFDQTTMVSFVPDCLFRPTVLRIPRSIAGRYWISSLQTNDRDFLFEPVPCTLFAKDDASFDDPKKDLSIDPESRSLVASILGGIFVTPHARITLSFHKRESDGEPLRIRLVGTEWAS